MFVHKEFEQQVDEPTMNPEFVIGKSAALLWEHSVKDLISTWKCQPNMFTRLHLLKFKDKTEETEKVNQKEKSTISFHCFP